MRLGDYTDCTSMCMNPCRKWLKSGLQKLRIIRCCILGHRGSRKAQRATIARSNSTLTATPESPPALSGSGAVL